MAGVGLTVVGIEIHHVTPAEVRAARRSFRFRNAQRYQVVAASLFVRPLFVGNGESHVDVARLQLLVECHAPQVGSGHVGSVVLAHLLYPLLPVDKGHHALQVGSFQRLKRRQGSAHIPYLRLYVATEEVVAAHSGIDRFRPQVGHDGTKTSHAGQILQSHHLVTQSDGFPEQRLVEMHVKQSQSGRIVGVEQTQKGLVDVLVREVTAQHAIV